MKKYVLSALVPLIALLCITRISAAGDDFNVIVTVSEELVDHEGNIGSDMLYEFYVNDEAVGRDGLVVTTHPAGYLKLKAIITEQDTSPDVGSDEEILYFSNDIVEAIKSGNTYSKSIYVTVREHEGRYAGSYDKYCVTFTVSLATPADERAQQSKSAETSVQQSSKSEHSILIVLLLLFVAFPFILVLLLMGRSHATHSWQNIKILQRIRDLVKSIVSAVGLLLGGLLSVLVLIAAIFGLFWLADVASTYNEFLGKIVFFLDICLLLSLAFFGTYSFFKNQKRHIFLLIINILGEVLILAFAFYLIFLV